ncbi:D-alanine--D-alanine ligase family protein [Jannaschia donghaensis]|uniref:D-alanine--D-alanine ligase n=1 Tax=Jannaschia donghaensis TaxID=420998 RepID=A0A0M6YLV9_9RHOB|nr:hypothetical protein [Jannaschia donghaensis]CTQ50884.1 D-alanine--D-alanine ligase [Jannaschia donghaensis]
MDLLHLAGATTTPFYRDLSLTYQRNVVTPTGTHASLLVVDPDGNLHFGRNQEDLAPITLADALHRAAAMDVVVPHMFCPPGMTSWRSLFEDVAGVPVVGPPLLATTLSTSKLATKSVARAAGVATPDSRRLRPGDRPDLPLPLIVKPDAEDNSLGLTLVRDPADLGPALDTVFAHGDTALAERFIPGREVRVGVLDLDGAPRVLPILEYHVTADRPIRERADKVMLDDAGRVTMESWERPSLPTTCPADLGPDTLRALRDAALTMHEVLGCRDYSLFDFRIEDGTKTPYLLEACSFWTFTPVSVISRMVEAEGGDLVDVSRRVWAQAAARKK